MDSTLTKMFAIKERCNLEFRFEAYNLTKQLRADQSGHERHELDLRQNPGPAEPWP